MIRIDTWCRDDCTLGVLTYNEFKCFTLEKKWVDNLRDISCIPAGRYETFKRVSPRQGREIIQLDNVPNRNYIQIHPGNFESQVHGCILVGDSIRFINADNIPDVGGSVVTFNKLMALVPDKCEVLITRS